MIHLIINRIVLSLTTLPRSSDIWMITLIIVLCGLLIIWIGFRTEFLRIKVEKNIPTIVSVCILSLLAPALLEELIFRAVLIPAISENAQLADRLAWGLISLFSFIIYHPVNGTFVFRPGKRTFLDARFLVLCGILGFCNTSLYMISGSIWPPVLVHWLFVCTWQLLFGGLDELYRREEV